MAYKRERGTGSISETGSGFKANIRLPGADGTIKQHSKRTRTYAEADAWLSELISRTIGGSSVQQDQFDSATLTEFLRHWIIVKFRENATHGVPTLQTLALYNSVIANWIAPSPLGAMKLQRIHRDNISQWIQWLHQQKSPRTGKLLGQDRKAHAFRVLRQAFRYATENGVLAQSPMSGVKSLTQSSVPMKERTLTNEEFNQFVALIQQKGCNHANAYCYLRWALAIYTARRQGEVNGLYWNAVHLDGKTPHMEIRTHLVPMPWRHGCGSGKRVGNGTSQFPCGQKEGRYCPARTGGGLHVLDGTKAGKDLKPLVPLKGLVKAFKTHKKAQDKELAAAVEAGTFDPLRPDHHGLVFVQPKTGRPYSPKQDDTIFKSLLKEAGISTSYRIHDLRHTAVSRIVNRTGGDLPVAQRIAGHKSFMTTLKYSHPDLGAMEAALDLVMGDEPGG